MSGKPSPDGVAETIALLEKVAGLDREIEAIVRQLPRLALAKSERETAFRELVEKVDGMDVAQRGNAGWEGRMGWFLGELLRQVSAKR